MQDDRSVRRFDTVQIGDDHSVVGHVVRAARRGAWADVVWYQESTGASWSKRQPDRTVLRVINRDGNPMEAA